MSSDATLKAEKMSLWRWSAKIYLGGMVEHPTTVLVFSKSVGRELRGIARRLRGDSFERSLNCVKVSSISDLQKIIGFRSLTVIDPSIRMFGSPDFAFKAEIMAHGSNLNWHSWQNGVAAKDVSAPENISAALEKSLHRLAAKEETK